MGEPGKPTAKPLEGKLWGYWFLLNQADEHPDLKQNSQGT